MMTENRNIPRNPLTNLRGQIREHWAKYRPKMFAEMEAKGTLDDAIRYAAQQTEEAISEFTANPPQDMTPAQAFWAAWELYRGEWAFLSAEESLEQDDEEETEVSLYSVWMLAKQAEAQVDDIWDEKNERWITPMIWDDDKEELVPTGEWNEETEEWRPYPGFEYLNPPLEN